MFSEDWDRKKFHNAVEFFDRLINKLLSESCFLEEQFIFPILRSSYPEVFCKKVFFEISRNSQENTSARKTLWHSCYPANFSKNTFLHRTPLVATSVFLTWSHVWIANLLSELFNNKKAIKFLNSWKLVVFQIFLRCQRTRSKNKL